MTSNRVKIGVPTVDREPERLLAKVAAQLGSKASPKLLTFRAGPRMNARARFEDLTKIGDERTRLIIDLYDGLDDKNIATQSRVQWPNAFSADFAERSKIEGLLAEFLQPSPRIK